MTAAGYVAGREIAASAAQFVGVPFRLHGRTPAFGLDCIGLVAAAFEGAGLTAIPPTGYGLRNSDIRQALALAAVNGLNDVSGPVQPGDILLVRPGPAQFHLLVAEHGTSFIHAHAGLRRIVRTPGPLPWPIDRQWRHIFEE